VAASLASIIIDGTYMIPKKPIGAKIRYRRPAILAVLLIEFIF